MRISANYKARPTTMAMINSAAMTQDERVLVIQRVFDAPRPLVWTAWLDFNHATSFDGPPAHPMKSMRSDLRVGGKWRNVMRHEGSELPQSGVYREIREPELLAFTFAWEADGERGVETLVTLTFEEVSPEKTRLTLQQGVFLTTQTRDGHRLGWNRTLDVFTHFLEPCEQ